MARRNDVIEHPVTGEQIIFLRTAEETNGELVQMGLVVKPAGFVSAAHVHPHQEERFEIQSGALTFAIDGDTRRVAAGGKVVVPAGTPHAWWNADAEEAVAVVEFRPTPKPSLPFRSALELRRLTEECFETFFGLAQDGKVDPRTGMPDELWGALILLHYHPFAHVVEPPLAVLLEMMTPVAAEAKRRGLRLPYPYPYARLREAERLTA